MGGLYHSFCYFHNLKKLKLPQIAASGVSKARGKILAEIQAAYLITT